MGLISNPPAPASPDASTVVADGWFPAIDCNRVRDEMRIGKVVTHDRLTFAITGALLSVLGELAAWKAEQVAAGASDLGDVLPDDRIAGETRLTVLYRRAVSCHAAADLAEQHRELSATDDGEQRADEIVPAAADLRRMASFAIRDFLGTTRTAVELI